MEFKDYYKIMGVSKDASLDEIKRAYRKLARKYHPDVSKEPNAEAKFKEVGEAYEVLKDPEKRARYDGLSQQGWRGGAEFNSSSSPWGQSSRTVNPEEAAAFSDFFESLFGSQARAGGQGFKHYASKGEDVYYVLEITPEDSYHGATRAISIPIVELSKEGRPVRQIRHINVKIPKGVINDQQIRLKGQGNPGFNGGEPGDLYLEIALKNQAPFHIDNRNITLFLPVTPWEAALGAKIKVPTLGGPIEVKIPENSQSGSKLRLKGRGLPGSPPGDQFIELQIMTPPATTSQAKELYQQMADTIQFNPRIKLGV